MIYFDHAATTASLPEAAQAAMKTMTEDYGNPSSLYQLGVQAAKRMGEHREQVARALGCQGEEVYFYLGEEPEGDNSGRCPGGPSGPPQGPAHHHHGDRARRGCFSPARVGAPGIWRSPTSTPDASGRVRVEDLEAARPAGHRAGVHDAGEQ